MRPALSVLSLLVLLAAGCGSSPPRPPEPDESSRRAANTPAAVELQICRSNLQNTRITASEVSRQFELMRAYGAVAAASAGPASTNAHGSTSDDANTVYTLRFAFGSSRLQLPDDAQRIVVAAREAQLVVLRGRTDGQRETPSEIRTARSRTAAVQAWLVDAGVDPSRIRATWQAVGDPVADNATEAGRALNRRVEIEIYRTAPRFVAAGSPAIREPSSKAAR